MKEIRFEYLRPEEIAKEKEKSPFIILPLSPLEWHGPQLPIGFDGLNAYLMATELARRLGSIILPPLYIGIGTVRPAQILKNMGLKGDEYVVGMDGPYNPVKSVYFKEEVFAAVLRNYLEILQKHAYKAVIIVNTHGEDEHNIVMEHVARDFNKQTPMKVLVLRAMNHDPEKYPYDVRAWYPMIEDELVKKWEGQPGHATKAETSLALKYFPDRVSFNVLPPRGQRISVKKYNIVDCKTYCEGPLPDYTIRDEEDPRDATAEEGERIFQAALKEMVAGAKSFLKKVL